MRTRLSIEMEKCRIQHGRMASNSSYGMAGAFVIYTPLGRRVSIISSGVDSEFGWEHVSVAAETSPPIWDEMCFVKNLFWEDEETVMQLHPPKSQYVNCHKNCLHLWRPIHQAIPLPPTLLVGPK